MGSAAELSLQVSVGAVVLEIRAILTVLPPRATADIGKEVQLTVKVALDLPSKNLFQMYFAELFMQILSSLLDSMPAYHQPCKPHPPCTDCARLGRGSLEGSHKTNSLSMFHTFNMVLPRTYTPDGCLGYIYI